MKKRVYFDKFDGAGWPLPSELEPYFLTAEGRRQFFVLGNDSWGLRVEGVDGTDRLQANHGRIDVYLDIIGDAKAGVLLGYRKWGGGRKDTYYSKGDLSRIREIIMTDHGDQMPQGLYVSFETAWKAIREFIETDGKLPTNIPWIAAGDLPADTFPAP